MAKQMTYLLGIPLGRVRD